MSKEMIKLILTSIIMLSLGAFTQNYTGVLTDVLNPKPKVYSEPFWYKITRMATTIRYQTEGERYVRCEFKAPITADLRDKHGSVISRELVRKTEEADLTAIPPLSSDKSIIGVPTDKNKMAARKFSSDNFIIVSDDKTLKEAVSFIIRTECFNTTDGRFLGEFGPFPIPASDGVIDDKQFKKQQSMS